jgi:hypothetical protein
MSASVRFNKDEKRSKVIRFAGTINGEGSLEVRVTKKYSDTTLSKITHRVEEAQSQRHPHNSSWMCLQYAIGDGVGVARFPPPTDNFRCRVGVWFYRRPVSWLLLARVRW